MREATRKIAILMVGMMSLSGSVQAMTITDTSEQQKTLQGNYIDVRNKNFSYKKVTNFLVSPLQIVGEVLSSFNQERDGYAHEGIDIRVAEGTPIFASADGVVTKAAPDSKGVDKGGGHMIFIDFGNGAEGRYMHLSAYAVKQGDVVKAGQVIGFTGNSGESTTPHLHFEYRVNDIPIDPTFIFEASGMLQGTVPIGSVEIVVNNSVGFKESFYVIQS